VRQRLAALGFAGWRDEISRRLLRNVGYLVSGNAVAAGLGLATLALTARALGPEGLGILALIEAYARLVDRLLRLEPWQALIKYGADALEHERPDDFRQLLKFGLLLDAGGALLASLIAVAGVYLVGPWFDWSGSIMDMAAIYSLSIMFSVAATPTAVMRLFDRFALFAWLDVAVAGVRLAVVVIAWASGAGLWTFLLLAFGTAVARHLGLLALAWRELYRQGYADCLRQPLRGLTRNCPGIWDFIWWLNASILIRKSTRELDTVLVGGLLDSTAVGLYHVAKRLGDAALKLGVPIQQAIFPDVARLWARGLTHRLRQTVHQVNLAGGALAGLGLVVVALNVDRLLALTVGEAFGGASGALVLQMAAVTLILGSITLRPALLSMGLQRTLLHAAVIGSLSFYVCLVIAVPILGVSGASLAHLVFNGVWLVICMAVFERRVQQAGGAPASLLPGSDDEPLIED
jgi:O-antigen/teichoic acid export membrane protein